MTMPDLPERPGQASETRQMVERGRTHQDEVQVSGRAFAIAIVAILALIGLFALARL